MSFLRRAVTVTAVGAFFAVASTTTSLAGEVMKISSWAPPGHLVNSVIWPTWGKMIEEATNGNVTVEVEYGLAPPPGQIDLVEDGAADASWIFHGYNPGRFVTTKLVELPGFSGNAQAASVAHWRAHEKYLASAGEHDGVVVAGLMTHGTGHLHMSSPITSLADAKGKKIRIGGGVSADVGAALGVVGVQVPAPKVYETVSSGVADGVMMPMETIKSFRLIEIAPNTLYMPGGFYRGSFSIIVSEDFLSRLSDEDRAAVESTFGEGLSSMAGAAWDAADVAGMETVKADGTFTEASAEDQAAFAAMTGPIREKVVAEVAAKGIDAAAALALIEEVAGSYGK